MVTIDEAEQMLDEIATELPQEFYEELNGGIILLPDVKINPVSRPGDELYILGEYHLGGGLGRYISIYFGSFERIYGHLSREEFKKELEYTLKHEFTHHLECLAGERDLEKEDDEYLYDYLHNPGGQIRRRRLRR